MAEAMAKATWQMAMMMMWCVTVNNDDVMALPLPAQLPYGWSWGYSVGPSPLPYTQKKEGRGFSSTLGFQNTCGGFFSTPQKSAVRTAKIVVVAGERLYHYHYLYLYHKEGP
jgi:hypothetical protein